MKKARRKKRKPRSDDILFRPGDHHALSGLGELNGRKHDEGPALNGRALPSPGSLLDSLLPTQFLHPVSQPGPTDGISLLELYNIQLVDFIRVRKDGRVEAVHMEGQATHQLIPTAENKFPPSKDRRDHLWKPGQEGYALAVCLEPLRPRLKASPLKIKHRFPRKAPAYSPQAGIVGKRAVLRVIVKKTGVTGILPKLKRFSSGDCDHLYDQLIRASRIRARDILYASK